MFEAPLTQFSWKDFVSQGALGECGVELPAGLTRASAAVQGDRPTKAHKGAPYGIRLLQPDGDRRRLDGTHGESDRRFARGHETAGDAGVDLQHSDHGRRAARIQNV